MACVVIFEHLDIGLLCCWNSAAVSSDLHWEILFLLKNNDCVTLEFPATAVSLLYSIRSGRRVRKHMSRNRQPPANQKIRGGECESVV